MNQNNNKTLKNELEDLQYELSIVLEAMLLYAGVKREKLENAIFLKVRLMKNLSIQEKKDLDNCVFQNLGRQDTFTLSVVFKNFYLKIKAFIYSK